MKKYLLFLLGCCFSISINAQDTFIPQSYWERFNIDDVLQMANNGDATAQLTIGLYYVDVTPDNEKFKYWIEKAAAQNNSDAQYVIARCYAFGDYGFTQDDAKVLEYARKAAAANKVEAIQIMSDAYRCGLFGLPKDFLQAIYWAKKGALLGDADCQYLLGLMMYMDDNGVQKDEKEALQWWQKSAAQKNIDAQCMLITHYGMQDDEDSRNKLISVGLDFLINPDISQNSKDILSAKGLVGFEFFRRKNYKKGIQLMREGLKTQDELLQFYWKLMNEYAREHGTTLEALENQ